MSPTPKEQTSYKDNKADPEPEQGWSPERCKFLARDCLAALVEWLDEQDA